MAASGEIICKIAFWYYRRMALIIGLITAAGLWFLYDGASGWPKKNVVALAKQAFEAAAKGKTWGEFSTENSDYLDAALDDAGQIELIRAAHADGGEPMPWGEFVVSPAGKDVLSKAGEGAVKKAFEAGGDPDLAWAGYARDNGLPVDKRAAEGDTEVGIDGFVAIKGAFDSATKRRDWAIYGPASGRKGWGSKEPKYHSQSEITGQFAFAYGLWAIAAVMLVWAVVNSRRVLRADGESFTTETGVRVPFDQVFSIDKRKWDNKGLAYARYKSEGGGEKRAVIDDLKYIGADQVLARILDNFEGELIERVSAGDQDGGDDRDGGAEGDGPQPV